MSCNAELVGEGTQVQQLIDEKYVWMRRHAECTQQLQRCQRAIQSLLALLDAHMAAHTEIRNQLAAMAGHGTAPHEQPAPARRRHEQGAAR